MGADKLIMPFNNKPMLQNIIDTISKIDFDEKIVVIRENISEYIKTDFRVIVNQNYLLGQSTSVKIGINNTKAGNAMLFIPADMPLLDRITIKTITNAYNGNNIVYPLNESGEKTAPVLFSHIFRKELLNIKKDNGGSEVIKNNLDKCTHIKVNNPLVLKDIDTPEDYGSLKNTQNG